MTASGPTRVAFVCVRNAGRSQMAYAFARRELKRREGADIDVVMGGTQPASHVHTEVIDAMAAVGIDIAERTPRGITVDELQNCEYVVTMGCSAADVCPATWAGENRDWDLTDPDGKPDVEVARIREEIEGRVRDLFDEILER